MKGKQMADGMNDVFNNTVGLHKRLVSEFENTSKDKVLKIVKMISEVINNQGCIYLCGNGGSASDAQHIAGEFVVRFKRNRRALPAVALTTDTSILTSIGNDYSFEELFSKQLEALASEKDLLWALSTSGKSRNVLAAIKFAKNKGMKVVAFTGNPGSELEGLSDISLTVSSEMTASVQEIHELAYHIICELVEINFLGNE